MHSAGQVLANASDQLNSSEDQLPVGLAPRYAEHFVGAAALVGAFGLLFGAMALGAWLLFRTTLIQFNFFREMVGQGAPKKRNQQQIDNQIAELRRMHSRGSAQRASRAQTLQRRSSLGRSGSLGPPIASVYLRRETSDKPAPPQ